MTYIRLYKKSTLFARSITDPATQENQQKLGQSLRVANHALLSIESETLGLDSYRERQGQNVFIDVSKLIHNTAFVCSTCLLHAPRPLRLVRPSNNDGDDDDDDDDDDATRTRSSSSSSERSDFRFKRMPISSPPARVVLWREEEYGRRTTCQTRADAGWLVHE